MVAHNTAIKVSQRLNSQIPAFIKEDNDQFVNLLTEYYKSQEKSGRPYDILNNILAYVDIGSGEFNPNFLSSESAVLEAVDPTQNKIVAENVNYFLEKDGTLKIDNEVLYYESVTHSPDIVFTPGVNKQEFDRKVQEFEPINSQFNNSTTEFNLRLLGRPVTPQSSNHLLVVVNNEFMFPDRDYFVEGDRIRFVNPPEPTTGALTGAINTIRYLIGYTSVPVRSLDTISVPNDATEFSLKLNTQPYSPLSTVSSIVVVNRVEKRPFEDFTVFEDKLIFKQPVSQNATIDVRSVELIAPEFGSGASAVSQIDGGAVNDILVRNGGSGYRVSFAPRITIQSNKGTGAGATAEALVNGIKNTQLLFSGQGYSSNNPPIVVVDAPADDEGTRAQITAIVSDELEGVSELRVTSSGSGYDRIPSIKFVNPGGATISDPTVENGSIVAGSISVTASGSGYTTAPLVYMDPPTGDNAINATAQAVLDADGRVERIDIISSGQGYEGNIRARIIDPVGAQILDVSCTGGRVTNIELLTGGKGYTDAPSVYIVDNRKDTNGQPIGGTGATAVATIFNGEITDINITSFGTGYSDTEPPKVFIAAPPVPEASCDVGFGEITGFTIHSAGQNYQPSAFVGVKRGVSAVTSFDQKGHQVYSGESSLVQSSHAVGSVIHNLDNLFAKELYRRFVNQYLPNAEIDYKKVNAPQIIKTISDFYASKGTKISTQYLFKILYSENVDVSYPKDEIIKPSAATWNVDTVLRADLLEGNPENLIDSQLIQYVDDVDTNVKGASALIENVIAINTGVGTVYELAISEETLQGAFTIPYKTTLVEELSTTESIITVDSTIGWPERNGTIRIDDNEVVQYKEKTLNQFIECTRSKNGVVEDWDAGTTVFSDIFVYVNRGTENECKLRVLGIADAESTVLSDNGSYYLPGDKLNVASLGSTSNDQRITSWLYNVKKLININEIVPGGLNNQTATVTCSNNHGLLVGDTVTIYGANPTVFNGTFLVTSRINATQFEYNIPAPAPNAPQGNILLSVDLNKGKSPEEGISVAIRDFTTNVQNTFFNDRFAYIASSGIPNYQVGPFVGSALLPGNQRKLIRIPRVINTISRRTDTTFGPIGAWVNGVSTWSYKSETKIKFGGLTGITIDNPGQGYDAANPPIIEINGGGGSGAKASVVVNGALSEIEVSAGGTGYTSSPLVSIVGGGGFGATATAVITNGVVSKILVETPGQGYTSQPDVSISGGGGTGCTATAQVRGPIQSVNVDTAGAAYTSSPDIKLNSGEGAVAQPIIINGRIVSIAIIAAGRGYTTAPEIVINGDGYGAIARATIGAVGEDRGKVIGVTVVNRGVGYTTGNTTVRLDAVGEMAEFTATVFEWTRNLQDELGQNFDTARGYVFAGYNTQYGGEYAHLSDPKQLRYVLGDNVFKNQSTQQLQELTTGYQHSPILGWAFDGNPIYGPYGYIDATDQSSGIRRIRSSYRIKPALIYDAATNLNPVRADGPLLSDYIAGSFIDDFEYVFQEGDLDQYNGRFCKTPEFPEGVYAYFVSIDASDAGNPVFPYICGPQLYSSPDEWNFSQDAVQTNIPADVVRFRDPYEDVDIDIDRTPNQATDTLVTELGEDLIFEIEDTNRDGLINNDEATTPVQITEEPVLQLFDYYPKVSTRSVVDIDIETTTKFEDAKVDGFVVENPGVSYKVNDKLFFDNEGTDGFGASAKVEAVKGLDIAGYSSYIQNDLPYGRITTATEHELRLDDQIIVTSTPILDDTNKTFKVKVISGVERVTIDQEGLGYSEDIPPSYEVITNSGQDFNININRDEGGAVRTVDIINSGSGYDKDNPPQIRVSHPQRFKKASYFLSLLTEAGSTVTINDIKVADDRTFYVAGQTTVVDGNTAGVLAKFNSDGRLLWKRTLIPTVPANSDKSLSWKAVHIENSNPHNIYVIGETVPNVGNLTHNPDIVVAKYQSGFDNANNPDGIIQWQRDIAGISGSTRRDYASDIRLDQDGRVMIAGYTDSNSTAPDDMWVALLDLDGSMMEKRKIASAAGSEHLHKIQWRTDDTFLFCGISDPAGAANIIIGETYYDTATIEVQWSKQIESGAYQFADPTFTIDEYGSVYVTATAIDTNGKNYGVLYAKFDNQDYTAVSLAKMYVPTGTYTSVKNAGVSFDVFGNIDISAVVERDFNAVQSITAKISWNTGTVLSAAEVTETNGIGYHPTCVANDNSGDTIVAGNKVEADQLAIFNWNTADNLFDETYNDILRTGSNKQWAASGNAVIDNTKFYNGASSLKLDAPNSMLLQYSTTADQSVEWTMEGWFALGNTQYAAQASKPEFFGIVSQLTQEVKVGVDGTSSSANFGKIFLDLNGSTSYSTGTTFWTAFNSEAWVHIAISKERPGVGSYIYRIYVNGVEAHSVNSSTVDVNLMQATLGPISTPSSTNNWIGWIDNFVVTPSAKYTDAFTAGLVTGTNSVSKAFIYKIDKDKTKLGSFSLNNVEAGHTLNVAAGSNYTFNTQSVSVNPWIMGPAGIQILDYSDVVSTHIPGVYTITSTDEAYASRTATIPTQGGKKLLLTTKVIPKFYIRDARYSSIDLVKTITFNQNASFTKGSVLQQYSVIGGNDVVSAYGTVVESGTNSCKIGKIIGNFDTTKLLKSTAGDVNEMDKEFTVLTTTPVWQQNQNYAVGDVVYNDGKIYTSGTAATAGAIAPTHTSGTVSDGNINWAFTSVAGIFSVDLANSVHGSGTLAQFASWKPFDAADYTIKIQQIYPDSSFIKGDTIDADAVNLTFEVDTTGKIATFGGLVGVKQFNLQAKLNKDVVPSQALTNTDLVYCSATSRHNFSANDIIFTERFTTNEYNGSFFVEEVFTSRDFTYKLRSTAVQDPTFSGQGSSVSNINIYAKHPKFLFVRGHQYIFDLDDPSNLGYFLSFSKDNQYKLEYPFINIIREGTPGFTDDDSPTPLVKFIINDDVTNISYYFDPSRTTADDSPVGEGSFIDVIQSPYQGTFTVNRVSNDGLEFDFPLLVEPEKSNAPVGNNEFGNPRSFYSTTSLKAIGPIATIKLVNPGGFYQKLPIVTDISSNREIEKVRILNGGTEYVNGVYYNVPIGGDGEGASCNITVTDDGDFEGVITDVVLTSAGKGYTTASIDVDAIPGILGPLLAGSGAQLDVVIPSEGSGASVFLQGKSIGRIKKLKNNEFGFGYSHDYTLRPEITFPVNLQLFNTAILAEIKITDPGSGYTSTPAVVIEGGGGTGAEAEAVVKNNRLSEVIIKDPGAGYSSEPSVTLKSEFNYVVNIDLGYLQFNFPHGITTGAEVQLRAEDLGSTVGILPKPSSAGLVSLSSTQTYYAIAGEANGLESDQLRISLTKLDAESGSYITFLTQGEGRQILLTEVFGGQATAIVETSRFLEGELVYQGSSLELASATGYVSTNQGWQIGPRILKLENYKGVWTPGERVTGEVSRASGLIDNLSIARGTLNIDSLTNTPGQFIDDVGKPSEIVQKIQDSYFYQNFSYVIKSETPINQWRKPVLETNHPVGFNLFGELAITGGKDISGRKVVSDLIKEVNINAFTNINQITSFANAQPIYTQFNNTEVLFRQKRLTNSEEILTSIVKKIDNVSDDFDGVRTQFPLNVEGGSITATEDQMFVLLNGVAQSPGDSFSTSGPSIVFSEPPKAPSRIKFRNITFTQLQITRLTFSVIGGIFPLTGNRVRGLVSEATATVIDSGTDYIDVINIEGTFQSGESVLNSATGFNSTLDTVNPVTSKTIFEQGERITNLQGKFAIIEENNLDDGNINDSLVVSRTSGTAKFETGEFEIKFNDVIYSARSNIAATVSAISPYQDEVSEQIIDTVDLSPSSSFFALVFQRVPSITYPNVILDDIGETVINPTELYDAESPNNQDFLDFESVRNQEIRYDGLVGTDFAPGTNIRLKKIYFGNSSIRTVPDTRANNAAEALVKNAKFIAEEAVGKMLAFYPSFTVPTGKVNCEDDIVDMLNLIAWQLEHDGNSEVWDAANFYVQNNTIYHVDGQVPQTVYAMNQARDLANQCINMVNITTEHTSLSQWKDLTITPEYEVVSNSHGDARTLLLANKWFIAYESLHYAKTQNPGYNVSGGDEHCLSDIVDVVEALAYNVAHGGNDFIWEATDRILHYGVTSGDRDTIVNSFTKAKAMSLDIMRNIAVTKAGSHGWNQVTISITADPASPTCQAVAASITTLMDILINALGTTASPGTRAAFQAAVTQTAPQADYSQGRTTIPNANACVAQTSAVANFFRIITDTLQDPTGADPTTYQWSISNVPRIAPAYTFEEGETIRSIKHSYKDKSSGGFFNFGQTLKGVSSGAVAEIIGTNAGSKWVYTKGVTGSFTTAEYITNSTITYNNVTVDKLNPGTGTGSLEFSGTSSRINHASNAAFAFGANDYTVEMWIYPTGVSGTQRLFDFRTASSSNAATVFLQGTSLKFGIATTDHITAAGAIPTANQWYHIAVSRASNVTKLFVNGQPVGSDYTDASVYGDSPIAVGASWNNGETFTGNIDNFIVRKGTASYSSGFIPPTVYDFRALDISFGFNGEAPFPVELAAVYATYQQTIISSANADGVELWREEIMTEEIDVSRDIYRDCADIIEKNRYWIAEEAVGRMKEKYPAFVIPGDTGTSTQGTDKCIRDTHSFIIPAIVNDLKLGGNFNTIVAGRGYLEGSGALKHVNGELLQSIYAWREVAKLCIDIITKNEDDLTGEYTQRVRIPNYFSTPAPSAIQTFIMDLVDDMLDVMAPTGHRFRDGADLLYFNRAVIADEAVSMMEEEWNVMINFIPQDKIDIPSRAKCVRDIRDHIVPAVAGDLLTGGNSNIQGMIDSYLDSQSNINYIEDELLAMLDALEHVKFLANKALQNLLVGRNENIANIAGTTPNTVDDFYQLQYSDLTAYRKEYDATVNYDLTDSVITESTFYPPDPKIFQGTHRALDSANIIERNARTIAAEAVDIVTKTSAFKHYNFRVPGGKVHCEDDIVDFINSVAHDLRFSSNSEVYDAAALYLNTDMGLKHVTGQSQETIYAYKMARDMSVLAIRNKLGFTPFEDNTGGGGGGQGGNAIGGGVPRGDYDNNATTNKDYDAGNEILNNLRFIASTAVGRGYTQYPNLTFGGYGYQSCIDDVIDILEAMAWNLKHGGNNKVWYATEFYITDQNAIQHINSQSTEVKYIFEQARDIAIQVMRQQLVTVNGYTEGYAQYDTTITIDSSSSSTGQLTPTNATYNPATGDLTLTKTGHGLVAGDAVQIATYGLKFTCDFDSNQSEHTYPRPLDPSNGALLPVTSSTSSTFTVNVGTTTNVNYDVTKAIYNETNGDMYLDIGTNNLDVGRHIKLPDNAITFTCTKDGNATNHSYPRSTDYASGRSLTVLEIGDSTFTATDAAYVPSTGVLTLTVPNHGFANGDNVQIVNNSLNFTCDMDNNYTVHSYPRVSDPAANKYLPVANVTTNTFTVNVGTTGTVNFTPSNVAYNPVTGNMVLTLGQGHGLVTGSHLKIQPNSLTFTCEEDDNATNHSYPRTTTTTHTVTGADYNGTTGIMTLTIPQHGFSNGDQIKIADNGVTFTCAQDGNNTNHSYPRSSDPASNSWLEISNVTANTFKVQVLLSDGIPSTNVTAHTFVSATSGGVTWKKDRAYDVPLEVTAATATTVTVNVLASGRTPSTNTTAHTFVSATTNAISAGGNYTHTFTSAVADGIRFKNGRIKVNVNPSPSSEQYPHTFVSAVSNAVQGGGNYNHTFVSSTTNSISWITGGGGATRCATQASAITTLMGITIDLFNSGTSNPQNYIDGVARTLPGEWPLTGERAAVRDLTITYDQAGSGACNVESSTISSLFDIVIGVVKDAAAGNGSYFTNQGITRNAPVQNNTLLFGGGTCYNVTSAANVLFDLLEDTLGSAPEMYRQASRLIAINDLYINREAYYKTMNQYAGYTGDQTFGDAIRKAYIYDMMTDGNAMTVQLINSWFDAEGNFVAFPNIFRTYLIFHAEATTDMITHILSGTAPEPGTYNMEPLYKDREMRPTMTAVHKIQQLWHLVYTALAESKLPTVYLKQAIDVGVDVNSDGSIHKPNHPFEAYDRVNYTVLGTNIVELDRASYYIHPDTTSTHIYLAEYIDGHKLTSLTPGLPGEIHTFSVARQTGITRIPTTYGDRVIPTPTSGGIEPADIFYGTTSGAYAEVIRVQDNLATVNYRVKYLPITVTSAPETFVNGEDIVKTGATGNAGKIIATDNATYIKVEMTSGAFAATDNIEGVTSGATATVGTGLHDRVLVNFKQGEFIATDILYSKEDSGKANALIVRNNDGALIDNQSGRITYDIETVKGEFAPNDVIYGSVTDQIIEVESFSVLPGFGEYIHSTEITKFTYAGLITDTGVTDTFEVGDVLQLQNSGQSVGHTFVVTEHDIQNNEIYLANETGRFVSIGDNLSVIANDSAYQLAKIPPGSNFPSVYTSGITLVTQTPTTAYGKIEKIQQIGLRLIIHLGDTNGTFVKNAQIVGDFGFRAACSVAKTLRGRVKRFFRGFDGVQQNFKLTTGNGTAYFPDPAGHMMIFVNGILQPPGGNNAYTAFSDNIQFTEAPAVGSTFHGVYVGKLRQLDDISFDFDSLRNSFNLKLGGVFYSLTLTDGVQSNTILPENNIICQLNGVIQEPGIGFEIVGSRIIFSEVPRAGSTFVAFSYIGSDVDVIAATVVPPVEAGDILQIEGEDETREVALIESSNSLITFEYSGAVKGRNGAALATIEKGRVTEAILTNSGDGYDSRPNVDVISSSGFGARIKALVGLARIDVKNSGQGYVQPTINVNTTVPDNFFAPSGVGVNGGIDIYDPNYVPPGESQAQGEQAIVIESQPVNTTVNQGQVASFTVIASTIPVGGTIAYQWQKKNYGESDWNNINGATSPTYTTPVTTQADGGDEFRCGLTAAGATPTLSNSAVLTINIGATTVDNFSPDQIFDDN